MIFSSKKDAFFEKLLTISENVQQSADFFFHYEIKNVADLKELSSVMKEYETRGDTYIHELIVALNKTFITPIEREDILLLGVKMDDVLDGLENASAYFEMFSLTEIDEFMRNFLHHIFQSTIEITNALQLMSNKKLLDMRKHAIKIKDHESKCDDILRRSIKHLFVVEKDPIKVIQYKEIYEILEGVADTCQDIANTIESIIMRNA